MKRRWLEGLVIAVAALASIATSKRRWHAEAELPAGTKGPAVVVIESSRDAHLVVGEYGELRPMERPASWPGTSRFLVLEGTTVSKILMPGDHCRGGMCSSDCSVPEGEFVRLTKVVPVATWSLVITGEQRTDTLRAGLYNRHQLEVIASDPTVKLTVESTLKPSHYGIQPHTVVWPELVQDTQVTWTPRFEMTGACPDERPCQPPPTAKLELTRVVDTSVRP